MDKRLKSSIEEHYDTLEVLAENADDHYDKYGIQLGFAAREILAEYHDEVD